MNHLHNKNILLGITGGIAAYKSAELCRQLKKAGAHVRVVMTKGAQAFITPLTFQALSGNRVGTSLLDEEAEAAMGHIELARWADLIIVAPASADTLAKLANGQADDLLTTLILASSAPLYVAPAMNRVMWSKAVTQHNVQTLADRDVKILGPASGEQACGETGEGRMIEPAEIISTLNEHFSTGHLAGKTVLITAGPTREAIDPVRYISNHSSGKMGYAIAEAALEAGARVILVSGPVTIQAPKGIERIMVESAEDMLQACLEHAEEADIFIATAAVADYRLASVSDHKLKKADGKPVLELVENPDILATVAALPRKPFCVGFAAETHKLEEYARTKLHTKQLDMIVANDVSNGQAFGQDENSVIILTPDHSSVTLARQSKTNIARTLVSMIADHINDN